MSRIAAIVTVLVLLSGNLSPIRAQVFDTMFQDLVDNHMTYSEFYRRDRFGTLFRIGGALTAPNPKTYKIFDLSAGFNFKFGCDRLSFDAYIKDLLNLNQFQQLLDNIVTTAPAAMAYLLLTNYVEPTVGSTLSNIMAKAQGWLGTTLQRCSLAQALQGAGSDLGIFSREQTRCVNSQMSLGQSFEQAEQTCSGYMPSWSGGSLSLIDKVTQSLGLDSAEASELKNILGNITFSTSGQVQRTAPQLSVQTLKQGWQTEYRSAIDDAVNLAKTGVPLGVDDLKRLATGRSVVEPKVIRALASMRPEEVDYFSALLADHLSAAKLVQDVLMVSEKLKDARTGNGDLSEQEDREAKAMVADFKARVDELLWATNAERVLMGDLTQEILRRDAVVSADAKEQSRLPERVARDKKEQSTFSTFGGM